MYTHFPLEFAPFSTNEAHIVYSVVTNPANTSLHGLHRLLVAVLTGGEKSIATFSLLIICKRLQIWTQFIFTLRDTGYAMTGSTATRDRLHLTSQRFVALQLKQSAPRA